MGYGYDIRFRQRETFDIELDYREADEETVVPLMNATAKAQIRPRPGDATLTEEFHVDLDAANGRINLSLSSAETEAMAEGRYRYDLVVSQNAGEDDENIFVMLYGDVIVEGTVTEDA